MDVKDTYNKFLKQTKVGGKAVMKHRIDNMCEEHKRICDIYCPNVNIKSYYSFNMLDWFLVFFEDSSILLIVNNESISNNYYELVSSAISGVLPENKVLVSNLPCIEGDKTVFLIKIENVY